MLRARPNGRLHFPTPVRLAKRRPVPRRLQRSVPAAAPPGPVDTAIRALEVVSRDGGWALMVDDVAEPAWVVSTKRRAVSNASDCAAFHGCLLRVRTKSGKVQRERDYAQA